MADGQECIHCGYQETDHELGRAQLPSGEECFDFEPPHQNEDRVQTVERFRKRLKARDDLISQGEINSLWDG